MDILDRPQGTGRVLLNGELRLKDVRYQVTVWRQPNGTDLQLDGRLDISYQDALELLEDERPLTLQLEDGRGFGFRVLTPTGRITGKRTLIEAPAVRMGSPAVQTDGARNAEAGREPPRTGIFCPTCHKPVGTVGHIGPMGLTMNCPACGHRWAARDHD